MSIRSSEAPSRHRSRVEDWVRDLARREEECCGFFGFTVTAHGQEVRWDASAGDGEAARQALAGFYRLADPRGNPGPSAHSWPRA